MTGTSDDRRFASPVRAAFASAEITPPLGVAKIGWLRRITPTQVLDPLYARVCVLETSGSRAAFVALDTLSVSRTHVAEIRRRIEATTAYHGAAVMVAATHNHAGPALVRLGDVTVDEAYRDSVTAAVVQAVADATSRTQEAEIGFGRTAEVSVPHNRRVVYRNGAVQTHGSLQDHDALYVEGPVDPILTTIGLRAKGGPWLGAIVNFTCHPTHHGDDETFSAGYPGVLTARLARAGIPNAMFLNGAQGNVHWIDPAHSEDPHDMEEVGAALAFAAQQALTSMSWRSEVRLRSSSIHIRLPFREATDAEINGMTYGAQRLVDPGVYDRVMPRLLAELAGEQSQRAEVQAIVLDDYAMIGVPAELFVELGLAIKERAYPMRASIVGLANGMVGYVPHREAFARGGYETTFGDGSKLAPVAGDLLVDAAISALKAARASESGRS